MKYTSIFAIALCSLFACNGEDDSTPLPEGCDVFVGLQEDVQSILQTKFIEAEEGSTICIGAGTFEFTSELSSSVNGVTIRGAGAEETILDFSAQDLGSNGLHITGNGVTLEDFEVRNTPGDGIRTEDVSDITYRRLRVLWTTPASADNGAYGLYPVKSTNVLIEDCFVTGASDAGIYVGQSSNILVRRNEVTGNVAGIEVENSVDAEVVDNNVYGNTGGILVFNLPELPMKDGKRVKVHNNVVRANNLENFARPGAFVYNVPGGSGIIILASDDNEITNNEITDNESSGVILTSYLDLVFGGFEDPEFDRNTEGNFLHGNTYSGNGTRPQGIIDALGVSTKARCDNDNERFCYLDRDCEDVGVCTGASGAPDIIWDGCLGDAPGPDNCFAEAEGTTFATPPNFGYCNDANARGEDNVQSMNINDYACSHDPLPNQSPETWTAADDS